MSVEDNLKLLVAQYPQEFALFAVMRDQERARELSLERSAIARKGAATRRRKAEAKAQERAERKAWDAMTDEAARS